jgi:hypothetical protein
LCYLRSIALPYPLIINPHHVMAIFHNQFDQPTTS